MPENHCPSCGAPLPSHALGGHCPRCLLLQRLDSKTLGLDRGSNDATVEHVPMSGSVLKMLSATIDAVPRVLLRDTAIGEEPSPITRPLKETDPTLRYRIDGEIARGGMGAVLKGRDPDLGRDVAIKVLREDLRDNGDLVRRFVEEAQIGGQLQHPGVVPIYELGMFADTRPFFSMKLVKGQTLADLLSARSAPGDDLPRFLSIYAAIAQTMAYAHTRCVIHRDLKPLNVMVGAFGEVLVMDWGLAKVLARGGADEDAKAGQEPPPQTMIATPRSGSGTDLSQSGSILGTPGYMAPEQARGETEAINERADVFALGSILCEVLTGQPAFTGRTSGEIVRKTARGETADALARLDASGAEAELIDLAKDCLAVEPEDRPRDANIVSERITAYLAGVQERLRATELARAAESARAEEAIVRVGAERRARRFQVGLAASLLLLTTAGGLGFTYLMQQLQAGAARAALALKEATLLRDQAVANPDDATRWPTALAGVKRAEVTLAEGGNPAARQQLGVLSQEVQAKFEAAERDRVLLSKLVDIRSAKADDPDGLATDAAYTTAFRAAGLDLAALEPDEAGARIRARPSVVALVLAAALDDWATMRRDRRKERTGAERLAKAARAADPEPWRNELHAALALTEKKQRQAALGTLAGSARFDDLGVVSLNLLGTALAGVGDPTTAETVLRQAQRRHPGDVWLNYDLARVLEKLGRRDDAIRFYTAARAVRPETAHQLAHALARRGESDEAIAVFRDLTRLRPNNGLHLRCLGQALQERGRSQEAATVLDQAVTAIREMIQLKPDLAIAHNDLGNALKTLGKRDEAVAAFREAVRLQPDYTDAHVGLGNALKTLGKLDEAVAAFREAIRLQPDYINALLGLGDALKTQGKLDEAVVAFREAIRLQPDFAGAHLNLGLVVEAQGKLDEAVVAFREAIRLQPDFAGAHYSLGNALDAQRKLDEAVAAYREAIRLRPDLAEAHLNLGYVLEAQGKLDEAVAAYREAIRLQPDDAVAHCNLGGALRLLRDYAGALNEYRKGHQLGSRRSDWHHPSAQWVAEAELMAALAVRLPGILKGDDQPKNPDERLAFAQMCYDTKRYATAARLWAEALQSDPKLGDDRQVQHRYNAACAAAMAAAGQGKDEPQPDDAEKLKLRAQVRGWLQAELAAWSKLQDAQPQARPIVRQTLQHWQEDTDLAAIRDAAALAKLPEEERAGCEKLWADVAALVKEAKRK